MSGVHSASMGPEFHTCDVHRLTRGDAAPRLCKWCNACQAWICAECWHSPARIEAFMKRMAEKLGLRKAS